MSANVLSEHEIIEQARTDLGETHIETLEDALEAFWGHGFHDSQCGATDEPSGHCFRVHRWLLWTDDFGFTEVSTFDSEAEAQTELDRYAAELAEIEA